MPFTWLRTQNKQRLKLLEVKPVVLPGVAMLHVPALKSVALQPARPIKKSGKEFTDRLPRPRPPNVRGQRTSSYSKPALKLCDLLVHESWSEYWIWLVGANEGFRPPPIPNAPVMFMTGGCV